MTDFHDLVRARPGDHDRAHDALRRLAFQSFSLGGEAVALVAEPMLRRGTSGLEQPIRVRSGVPITAAVITLPDGTAVEARAVGGAGDVRFFIPEQQDAAECAVRFPELGDEEVLLEVQPVRPWEVSLVHHSHFDIGYTDLQGRVIAEQLTYLDDALRLAEGDPSDGPEAFRWSVESLWVLREWISRRRPETVERFMRQVRDRRIEIAAMPFTLHLESCSTEELHGLLRYAAELSARYGVEIPLAYQTDVPGCVAGTVDALADAGVKYLSVAHNWAGRSVPYLRDGEHLPRLFRWASPAGNSVLVWMTTSAQGNAYLEGSFLGLSDNIDVVDDLLPLYLLNEQTRPFPYDENAFGFALGNGPFTRAPYPWNEIHLRVTGREADNAPPNRRLPEIVAEWNERWVSPKLQITRTQDFFERMESRHGAEIQTFTGDWNNWWSDGLGSAARQLQMSRSAQAVLSQAETVRAILPAEAESRFAGRVDEAWQAVELFDEHTWGAGRPWTSGDTGMSSAADQWHWKAEKAIRAHQESALLMQEALRSFAEHSGGTADASIWVINTAGHERGGLVEAFLPESLIHTTSGIRIHDARTGAELSFAERNQVNPSHRDAGRFVDLIVDDVPALGWVRLDITADPAAPRTVSAAGVVADRPASAPVWELDNGRLRVLVDPQRGSIGSIYNIELGAEIVDSDSRFGFNSYVHDRYSVRGSVYHLSGFVQDFGPELAMLADRATQTHVAFEDAGEDAGGSWLRYRSYSDGVDSVTTTLRLPRGADYLDISNRVVKPWNGDSESGFFAFPYAVAEPTIRYEVTGSVAGSDLPTVPGGADYLHAVRDWVALQGNGVAGVLVTKDAPLVQLGDIALPFAPFPGTLGAEEPATVFSWIHNNIWDTNFPSGQALDMTFAYRVAGYASADPETAGVHGADLASTLVRPLLAVAADPSGQCGETRSLLRIPDRRARLLSVRRSADGHLLVGLQSLAQEQIQVDVIADEEIVEAWQTTLLGARRGTVDVSGGRTVTLTMPAFGVAAVEIRTAGH